MTEDEIITRGHRARRLLASEDFTESMAQAQRQLADETFGGPLDPDYLLRCRLMHDALGRVSRVLQTWADELTKRNIG